MEKIISALKMANETKPKLITKRFREETRQGLDRYYIHKFDNKDNEDSVIDMINKTSDMYYNTMIPAIELQTLFTRSSYIDTTSKERIKLYNIDKKENIKYYGRYLKRYADNPNKTIRCIINSKTMAELFGSDIPIKKYGIKFTPRDNFPRDILMLHNKDMAETITKATSNIPALRGLYLVSDTGFDTTRLKDGILAITKDEYSVIKKGKYLFLDINTNRTTIDESIEYINKFLEGVKDSWYD